MELNNILHGDVREKLKEIESGTVQCVVTSPPYWGLRDYGQDGQLGLEKTPEEYVEKMVEIFREVKRVLKDDGTLWLNLGDSYCGYKGDNYMKNPETSRLQSKSSVPKMHDIGSPRTTVGLKPKDLVGIPWRVAFALQADGWWLRQDIIWHKKNPMPESVTDRCTKAHEIIFLLTKSAKYCYDADAIREPHSSPQAEIDGQYSDGKKETAYATTKNYSGGVGYSEGGRNKRSVWEITTTPYKEAHFAVFPPKIPELCIKAGSKEGDVVLDPFFGSGTTGLVAQRLGRKWIGIELNADYIQIAEKRLAQQELF